MPTTREIVAGSPSLQRLRGFSKGLMALTFGVLVAAGILWSQIAGKLLAAAGGLLFILTLSTLLSLGKQIEAIQLGPQPERLEPKSPPLFGGFLGLMGLLFVLISGGCAVASVLMLMGVLKLPESTWLAPFFAVLFSFVGLTNAEIGRAFAKARARETLLRERGLRGTALIRDVRQTGVQINDNPQVECT